MRINLVLFATLITLIYGSSNLSAQDLSALYPTSELRALSPGHKTYYVNPQSGNDNNTGIEAKSAWKTFKRINQLILSAGDKLEILVPGTFHESLALKAKGSFRALVKVKFAPGRYDIFPDHALKKQLHITNTNDRPDELKTIALLFDSCQYISVSGAKANIVLHGKMIETYMNNCANIQME
jgi:hypothetical protein